MTLWSVYHTLFGVIATSQCHILHQWCGIHTSFLQCGHARVLNIIIKHQMQDLNGQ